MQIITNPYNNLYTNTYLQGDSLAKNQSDDFGILLNSKVEKNQEPSKENDISNYRDIMEQTFEDYMSGDLDSDSFFLIHSASLTASLVEAYNIYGMDSGVDLFAKMKGIHQERLKVDCANEITTEIKKDISVLDNNLIGGSNINGKIPNHIYQAQKEKAKDILFEILEEIRV